MFKKVGIVATLSATVLFGGAFVSDVEASANPQPSAQNSMQVYYSVNGQGWNALNSEQLKQNNYNCFDIINGEATPNAEAETPAAPTENQPSEEANQEEANTAEEAQQNKEDKQTDGDVSQFEQEVVDLTNQEREKQGLAPLELDTELSKVAREKSKDMQANNYFDHNSPNYGSPFDMMQSFGIDYNTAGENIAQGQQTPEEVVDAWMNSQGHRENIMNGDFTHIGIGYVEQGNYWTQMFIGK
ncbi:CAP domain-containing protein [Oceanobacillus sp. J11TS1]|uniref:CAP domain-containing protein n=1 Tax=Oceanobacillus sp. J11TS1 TaxID=2807191 RepID=UPI001B1D8DF9|nr:CAP domain-containing protein [Oceanobacillus sp. J11TS1]GIO24914.1 serine protease [Oceanobacillus sp. J11TS1]